MSADLRSRVRRAGFILHALVRVDGRRFLILDHRGLAVKGTDEAPLTSEQVSQFLDLFDDPSFIPGGPT